MCGRFVSATDPDDIVRFFTVDDRKSDHVPPSWNVAPTDDVHAVVEHAEQRLLVTFRWGLVPHWSEDERRGARLINARAETAADKPAFRDAYRRRRCLIPADGFYEWRTLEDGRKQPHFIHDPAGRPLAFAGLWEVWHPPTAAEGRASQVRSCTILTTAADAAVRGLHDRMPVILRPQAWSAWLDRELTDPQAVTDLVRESGQELIHHPVSTEVNAVRHNHPRLTLPLVD